MVVFPFEVGLVCPILTCVIAREKNMWQDYQKIGFKSLADGQPLLAKPGQLLLKDAIRELHHCSLALDLRGSVLADLCAQLELTLDGTNDDIAELLGLYYTDPTLGRARAVRDNCFVSDYVLFDLKKAVGRLNQLCRSPLLLSLVESFGHPADGDYLSMNFVGENGELIYKTASSIVGVVEVFNEQLEAIGARFRLCAIDSVSVYTAYAMEIAQQKYLAQGSVLKFDCQYT